MKESELRQRATCSRCKRKLMESGLPIFATLREQNYIVDLAAVQRQQGLSLMLGAGWQHIGPDEDIAPQAGKPADLTLCASCRTGFLEWLEDA